MKNYLFLIPILFCFTSCEIENDLSQKNQDKTELSKGDLIANGLFEPQGGITVSGRVNIYNVNGEKKLELSNFSISSGPDLKVYLSTSNSPNEYINLGALDFGRTYIIPEGVDLSNYKYVLIHCQQYNHLFAIAKLNSIL